MDKKVKVKGLKKKVKVVKVVVKKVKVASETLLDWSSLEYLSDC
jgi:hypothetical protein